MKKLIVLALGSIGTLLLPLTASAHVKWFVDSEKIIRESHNTIPFYNATSKAVLIWSVLAFIAVWVFSIIDKHTRTPKGLLSFGLRHERTIVRISQIILGLFLITVTLLWKIVLVPEFPMEGAVANALGWLQLIAGALFVLNMFPRMASLITILLYITLGITHGFEPLLENLILLSLAVYFFIKHSPSDSWWSRKLDKHSIEIVRIGTGLSLIILALTEKLMYPELSLSFLAVHQWNFMQPLFPQFTDLLFVLSTGFAELVFGIIFILGYMTRTNTVLIAIFFALSVTTMAIQFQQWEVEDLVVYSAAILFIFYGHGKTKFFHGFGSKRTVQREIIGR